MEREGKKNPCGGSSIGEGSLMRKTATPVQTSCQTVVGGGGGQAAAREAKSGSVLCECPLGHVEAPKFNARGWHDQTVKNLVIRSFWRMESGGEDKIESKDTS